MLPKATATEKPGYTHVGRGIEDAILPACRSLGIGITAYGVLSRGLLGGNWRKDAPAAGDFRAFSPRFQGDNAENNLALVERLRPKVSDVGIDVVLGAEAPSLASLAKIARRDTRIVLHVDSPHMARLTAEADIAIGAAGSSTWERCTLGLPTLMIVDGLGSSEAGGQLSHVSVGSGATTGTFACELKSK